MSKRVCRCGLVFDLGKPVFTECPACCAKEAAIGIEQVSREPFGEAEPLINGLAIVLQCVAAWPHILIPGDAPGVCLECTRRVARRWDGLCGPCLNILAAQDTNGERYEWGQDIFQEGPKSYGEKHG